MLEGMPEPDSFIVVSLPFLFRRSFCEMLGRFWFLGLLSLVGLCQMMISLKRFSWGDMLVTQFYFDQIVFSEALLSVGGFRSFSTMDSDLCFSYHHQACYEMPPYCYDPLDPNGNITVTFDIYQWTPDGYVARVTIQNYYQYRHVDKPGWKLGLTWTRNEVIWSMTGAFATQQGNCSSFKFQTPHSCKRDPVIVDLMPDATAVNRSENCCHGGLLSGWAINPSNSFSSFEIIVGNLESNSSGYLPMNLTLMAPGPGYTCGLFADVKPTVFPVIGGRREVQVFSKYLPSSILVPEIGEH
ncbi:hypothetical protein HHK36_031217 [Tetracentron sinense]|uniref:COBRA-like protein n=1 Tax=Tetracentron sinense TaxID=13715 RepID=A0A835CZD5_TETSI|nr:hypothetical protein HHK36_031217 [Tetracentron sinense]